MRLFVAVTPDDAMRRAVLQVQRSVAAGLTRGSLTRAENLHLTLAFLGETPPALAGLPAGPWRLEVYGKTLRLAYPASTAIILR